MSDPLVTTPDPRRGLPIRTLCVQVLDGPDAGVAHRASEDKLAVGTDVVLTDDSVSRYHLELSRGRSGVRVVDCGSTNGTLIGSLGSPGAASSAGGSPIASVASIRLRSSRTLPGQW
ncbi:MAG TPA: FHA domain-containing protein [Kofleriaceae bacterium]|jgi:hypothetical protein|nr:FHA domain-containing protein [Kofleriaceae bacterium]